VDGDALLIWAVTEHLGFLMSDCIVPRIVMPVFMLCFYNLASYTFTLTSGSQPQVATQIRVARGFYGELDNYEKKKIIMKSCI
jgi:hypothetical protein